MKWVAVVLLAVAVAGGVWLTTHVEPYRVYVVGDFDGRARGWEVLLPWAARPVLAAYGAPVLALACALGWVVAKTEPTSGQLHPGQRTCHRPLHVLGKTTAAPHPREGSRTPIRRTRIGAVRKEAKQGAKPAQVRSCTGRAQSRSESLRRQP